VGDVCISDLADGYGTSCGAARTSLARCHTVEHSRIQFSDSHAEYWEAQGGRAHNEALFWDAISPK